MREIVNLRLPDLDPFGAHDLRIVPDGDLRLKTPK